MSNNLKQYYKHKYGGIYCLLFEAVNKSNNDEEVVVYEHVYPFEKKNYVRNKNEFYSNNYILTEEQLKVELSKPQIEFQKEIMNNKTKK